MSRRKKANARGWDAINKQREEESKPKEIKKKEEINEEEHQKKMNMLKEIGLLK